MHPTKPQFAPGASPNNVSDYSCYLLPYVDADRGVHAQSGLVFWHHLQVGQPGGKLQQVQAGHQQHFGQAAM
jgi:hypothetical protein